MIRKLVATATLAVAVAVGGPASASHIFHPGPYESRGACEAESAELSAGDRDVLLANFPHLFSSRGEVASFLTRAFACEYDDEDGQWYLIDHRLEVINSEWFQRRQR